MLRKFVDFLAVSSARIRREAIIRRIVSHAPPFHEDDLLAVSILLHLYPEAKHITVHPQEVPTEYLNDPYVIVVDVGGSYDPSKNNYDHHQNSENESSFLLVLKHFLPDYYEKAKKLPIIQFLDYKDRFGFKSASEKFGVPTDFLYATFISNLLRNLGPSAKLGEIFLQMIDEQYRVQELLEKIEVIELHGLKIAVSNEPIPTNLAFQATGADLLITPNNRNPQHTSVYKDTSKPSSEFIDFHKLKEKFPIVFIHSNGFLAVLDISFSEIRPEKIVAVLMEEG